MKKTLIIAVLALVSAGVNVSAKKTVTMTETPASDSRIEYVGRTQAIAGTVSYDWAGVYFRVRFTGPSLAMKCSDSKNSWFNLWVDKEMSPEADRKFLVAAKDTVIVLAEGLGKGEHEVILQKRINFWTGFLILNLIFISSLSPMRQFSLICLPNTDVF